MILGKSAHFYFFIILPLSRSGVVYCRCRQQHVYIQKPYRAIFEFKSYQVLESHTLFSLERCGIVGHLVVSQASPKTKSGQECSSNTYKIFVYLFRGLCLPFHLIFFGFIVRSIVSSRVPLNQGNSIFQWNLNQFTLCVLFFVAEFLM